MKLNESFEAARNFAVGAAQTAAQKAKVLAAIAKANVSIYAEEDKIRKAELQLGKLYYRDYAVGEEMDNAEYLPLCQKIDESKKLIAELKDDIETLRAEEDVPEADMTVVDVDVDAFEEALDEAAAEAAPAEEAVEETAEAAEDAVELDFHPDAE